MDDGRYCHADAGTNGFNPLRTPIHCTLYLWDEPKCWVAQSLGTAGPDAALLGFH